MEELLGHERGAVVGNAVSLVVPDFYSTTHTRTADNDRRTVKALHRDGTTVLVQLEVDECAVDGKRYMVGMFQPRSTATLSGRVPLLHRTRVIVEQLAVAALVVDAVGIVHVCNEAACRLLGYAAMEVEQHNVRMLMTDTDAWQHDAHLRRYAGTGTGKIIGKSRDVMIRRRDGRMQRVTLSVSKTVDEVSNNDCLSF